MAESPVLETDASAIADAVFKTPVNPFDEKGTIKVMLGEPSSGMIDCIAHDNRLDAYMEYARLESRSKFKFFTGNVGRCGVNYAREMMADEAIQQNMDYLFMIDDDMIIPRRCFERLFDTMVANKADMAAPICTQRLYPFYPVMYKHVYTTAMDGENHLENQFITDYTPNSVVTVDGIGFGVVLLSVPFLKKLKPLMPTGMFFSNRNVGEDIYFCIKARQQLDAKIIVDTSIKVGHLRHPEMATEYDFVKAKGLEKKFDGVFDEKQIKIGYGK